MIDQPAANVARPQLALVLGGGGARAAYQVGVLRGLARLFPDLDAPLLTGVSAGAINVAYLGNHSGTFRDRVEDLAKLWHKLTFSDVFEVSLPALVWRAARVGMRLSVGLPPGIPRATGMVDTSPLREFLKNAMNAGDGDLPGVADNIESGRVSAVAITALNYVTGQTITFVQGKAIQGWERPLRRGINTNLSVEHVMASSALPLVFPPIQLGNLWYGDGGIRLVAPLAPALHLGADRLLVLSTHYAFPESPPDMAKCTGPPSPAVILGALYNAVFLDQLDHDVLQMDRINHLTRPLPPEQRLGFRDVRTCVVRPSGDLGDIANEFEKELPGTFRYFMRRFGSGETKSQDLVSTVMFHEGYISKLLEMGECDAGMYAEQVSALLEP